MSSQIPLVKDLLDVYPNAKIDEHVDEKMINMYNSFSSFHVDGKIISDKLPDSIVLNYTDEEIYNYIKFINITCMDVSCYKHVVKYINKDNILFFDDLFNNYDILCELLPLLPYDAVIHCSKFEDPIYKEIKGKWIIHNMTWIKRYKTELLEPYVKFETGKTKYYAVNGIIYDNHKKLNSTARLRNYFGIIYDLLEISKKGHLDLVMYLTNIFEKNNDNMSTMICSVNHRTVAEVFTNVVTNACENGDLEMAIYMKNFIKSKNVSIRALPKPTLSSWSNYYNGNVNIIKYFMRDDDDSDDRMVTYSPKDIEEGLIKVASKGMIEMLDYLLTIGKGSLVNVNVDVEIEMKNKNDIFDDQQYWNIGEKIDLLTAATCNGKFETAKHLINIGIDLRKYGEKSIRLATKSENVNVEIVEYIIDKYIDIIKDNWEDIENFVNVILRTGRKDIVKYINDKYFTIDQIIIECKDTDKILSSAYEGGHINFIEGIIHNRTTKGKYVDPEKIVSVINHNDEYDCKGFLAFLFGYGVQIRFIDKIVDTCTQKGYLDLLSFIFDGFYEMSCISIYNCIICSNSEDTCMSFIDDVYANEDIDNRQLVDIIEASVKKGYSKLLNHIHKDKSIELPLNDLLVDVCSNNNFEIIKYLVELGADVNCYQSRKYIRSNEISNVIMGKHGNFEIVKYLIDVGLSVKRIIFCITRHFKNYDYKTCMDTVKYIYDNNMEDINSNETRTLFTSLCNFGEIGLVKYLYDMGIDTNKYINKVLNNVVEKGKEGIVRLILDHESLYDKIIINDKSFVYACNNGYTNIVRLLTKYVDLCKIGEGALIYACSNENLEIVVHLVESGVDFRFKNDKPLRLSVKYGYIDIVKYLVEMGANINVIDVKYYDCDIDRYLNEINSDIKLQKSEPEPGEYNDYDGYYSSDDLDFGDLNRRAFIHYDTDDSSSSDSSSSDSSSDSGSDSNGDDNSSDDSGSGFEI